jgi:hypothetical protein
MIINDTLDFGALTRHQYLVIKTLYAITEDFARPSLSDLLMVEEAVSSTALAHPEWDMDEVRSWDEWEKQ